MTHYYKDLAPKLFDMGYKPIPIRPKSKIPFMGKNESWQVDIDKAQVADWAANGKGKGGIAFTGLCAIDADIYNDAVSQKLAKYIKESFGSNGLLLRVGQRPKFLIPCSIESDIKSKWKNTFYDKKGKKHELEFLSAGDQYFLGYGTHPDTGKDFRWHWGDPLKVKADDLQVFDELDIAGIEDEFESICKGMGWTRKGVPNKGSKKTRSKGTSDDPFEDLKASGDMADKAGLAELEAWLKLLPNDWVDDRDNWITIGAAIHHETGGSNDGWSVFDSWSATSDEYVGRKDTITRWESFDADKGLKSGGDTVSRGTVIHILKEAGVWKQAEKDGDAARKQSLTVIDQMVGQQDELDIITKMNQKHAVIRIGSKVKILQESKDLENNLDLSFLSVPDFKALYNNKSAPDPNNKKKIKKISNIWLDSQNRRELEGIVFEPGQKETEGYYNLWKGFPYKPKKGEWGYFKDHIYNVVADGDETLGYYCLAWLATLLQDPGGRRPETCIVLQGGQGTGKGVFVNTIGKLFGDHFLPVSHASQVAGRFNSHLANKILVFIDEGFWAGDKKAEGVLKSIITEPYLAIEKKGVDIVRVKNRVNLIMASNNEWTVPANIADRRYCVLNVSEKHQGEKPYFKKIINQMYYQGGIKAMLYDLLKMDLSGIDVNKFEATVGLYEQKVHSMSTDMKYWHERLHTGEILAFEYNNESSDFEEFAVNQNEWMDIDCEKIYKDYIRYSEMLKDRFPKTAIQFGMFLKKICPGIQKKRRATGKRKMFYQLPTLKKCRSEFEKQIKQKITWDDDDDEESPF